MHGIILHGNAYCVDSEIGRFCFNVYDVTGASGNVIIEGTKWLPPLHAREWYQTFGFKELVLFLGATRHSYRNIQEEINRLRHQEVGGTPLNTLRDATEREGRQILSFLDAKTQNILEKNGFSDKGVPTEACPVADQSPHYIHSHVSEDAVSVALKLVQGEMRKANMSENMIEEAGQRANPSDFEQLHDSINVCVDDVEVKKQKETRKKKTKEQPCEGIGPNEPNKTGTDSSHNFQSPSGCNGDQSLSSGLVEASTVHTRPKVQNSVARIEHAGHGITLTGRSVFDVLLYVMAFIINNNLCMKKLLLFVDGQRSLHSSVLNMFSWFYGKIIVLDWFHLVEKIKEDLSAALKGRHIRNKHLKHIVRFLWYGLFDRAVQYVIDIPESDIRDSTALDRLIRYLERNRSCIPFYALRKKLGLQNSSNRVECANNLVTSTRQKKCGMSWSKEGSHSLTSLTVVVRNGHVMDWVENRVIPFQFAKAA